MIDVGRNCYNGKRGMCRGEITEFMRGILDMVSKGFREAKAKALDCHVGGCWSSCQLWWASFKMQIGPGKVIIHE